MPPQLRIPGCIIIGMAEPVQTHVGGPRWEWPHQATNIALLLLAGCLFVDSFVADATNGAWLVSMMSVLVLIPYGFSQEIQPPVRVFLGFVMTSWAIAQNHGVYTLFGGGWIFYLFLLFLFAFWERIFGFFRL